MTLINAEKCGLPGREEGPSVDAEQVANAGVSPSAWPLPRLWGARQELRGAEPQTFSIHPEPSEGNPSARSVMAAVVPTIAKRRGAGGRGQV